MNFQDFKKEFIKACYADAENMVNGTFTDLADSLKDEYTEFYRMMVKENERAVSATRARGNKMYGF